jgi:hypothetical protein
MFEYSSTKRREYRYCTGVAEALGSPPILFPAVEAQRPLIQYQKSTIFLYCCKEYKLSETGPAEPNLQINPALPQTAPIVDPHRHPFSSTTLSWLNIRNLITFTSHHVASHRILTTHPLSHIDKKKLH